MPGENVYSWSVTAADNATADSLINWAEGQARATVNNSSRSELAAHAKFRNLITGAITTGGTATAMTFVSGVGFTAVPTPMRVLLKVGATNDAGTTLDMDGIGAVAIKTQRGTDLVGGEMILNSFAELIYDGTFWVLIGSGNVGEYIEGIRPIASRTNLTDSVSADITQISLDAGDWDVRASGGLSTSGGAVLRRVIFSIGTVSATYDLTVGRWSGMQWGNDTVGNDEMALAIAPYRFVLTVPTTIYLCVLAGFSAGAVEAWGSVSARRMR